MALGRRGKAEIMMAGKCDRPYYITTNLETERDWQEPGATIIPKTHPLMTNFPHPAPLPVGFTASSCRISMWNTNPWETCQTPGGSPYPQMALTLTTTSRAFLPMVHFLITTVTKHWRTIILSWTSNPNPGTPLPGFLGLQHKDLSPHPTFAHNPAGKPLTLPIWGQRNYIENGVPHFKCWGGTVISSSPMEWGMLAPLSPKQVLKCFEKKKNLINQRVFVHLSALQNTRVHLKLKQRNPLNKQT